MSKGKNEHDEIVVGGGIAGLGVAAIVSAEKGRKVLVLERFPMTGGRMMSYEGLPEEGWRSIPACISSNSARSPAARR
jgi:flavin-dependent dehydrogenase